MEKIQTLTDSLNSNYCLSETASLLIEEEDSLIEAKELLKECKLNKSSADDANQQGKQLILIDS